MNPYGLIRWLCMLGCSSCLLASEVVPIEPFEVKEFVTTPTKIDQFVFTHHRQNAITTTLPCSDSVFIRRIYLDLIGVPPTPDEAKKFLADPDSRKRSRTIDALLERPEYVDYWTMKWCDTLRVKSEFPINLWPNAVQSYQRWIYEAVKSNMPYDQFARKLLTSSGSNFREPAVNFLRATQGRGPQPLANAVALTLMGSRMEKWQAPRRAGLESCFAHLIYKPTAEWKEEIVCNNPAPSPAFQATLPDGSSLAIEANSDPRVAFANWLIQPNNPWFAKNAVNRHWAWLFGVGIVHEPDDLGPWNPPQIPALLDFLAGDFVASGYNFKQLLRTITNSRVYQLSSIPREFQNTNPSNFAYYPVRRLEAEVLLDSICQITDAEESYTSLIPEPFTHIPPTNKSVQLADASITSSFLELFGRSQRDSGKILERNNQISPAQRLHLLNSSDIQSKLDSCKKIRAIANSRLPTPQVIDAVWLQMLSRFPTADEKKLAIEYLTPPPPPPDPTTTSTSPQTTPTVKPLDLRTAVNDWAWALINSKEFLYRH